MKVNLPDYFPPNAIFKKDMYFQVVNIHQLISSLHSNKGHLVLGVRMEFGGFEFEDVRKEFFGLYGDPSSLQRKSMEQSNMNNGGGDISEGMISDNESDRFSDIFSLSTSTPSRKTKKKKKKKKLKGGGRKENIEDVLSRIFTEEEERNSEFFSSIFPTTSLANQPSSSSTSSMNPAFGFGEEEEKGRSNDDNPMGTKTFLDTFHLPLSSLTIPFSDLISDPISIDSESRLIFLEEFESKWSEIGGQLEISLQLLDEDLVDQYPFLLDGDKDTIQRWKFFMCSSLPILVERSPSSKIVSTPNSHNFSSDLMIIGLNGGMEEEEQVRMDFKIRCPHGKLLNVIKKIFQ